MFFFLLLRVNTLLFQTRAIEMRIKDLVGVLTALIDISTINDTLSSINTGKMMWYLLEIVTQVVWLLVSTNWKLIMIQILQFWG